MNADPILDAGLRARAQAWLAQDPDPQTRTELAELLARADAGDGAAAEELSERFATRLAFGTAGLRGELGAGSNRMNRVLVAQAAAGLAAYLRDHAAPGQVPMVVIGYDGRRNSDVFARDTAQLVAGAGLRAVLLPRMLPTPLLAFAVRHLDAAAGVMVTASHNPPRDNGYKVYLGGADGGAQIVPPADEEIAAQIVRVAETTTVDRLPRSDAFETAPEDVVDAYVAAAAAAAPAPAGAGGLRWVYTALHGVGWETMARISAAAGYPAPITVAEQLHPDPAFPTVAFPNPEEPGAMDLAFRTAAAAGAELVIANDPDADRLAVGIPDPREHSGWRRLTGNEVGLLLGWRAARRAAGIPGAALACSLVSSPGLQAVAEHYGLVCHTTLTGFKWISRAPGLVYGFEEALGYLVDPDAVRDKDGLSAAAAVLQLAAGARAEGRGLADLLSDFAETFGHFASDQVSVRVAEVSRIGAMMTALRARPPARIGSFAVLGADDFRAGADGLAPADVLRLRLEQSARVIVRPSGTEPKLKLYLDVRGASADEARSRLADLAAGTRDLLATLP